MSQTQLHRAVRFGLFEVNVQTAELRRDGLRIRLQAKPFQVLQALLEKPYEVVTREELRSRLWPDESFGDFDNGLNTAVKRLRAALGDSAENPRYIETSSRSGYRFIGHVEPMQAPVAESIPERRLEIARQSAPPIVKALGWIAMAVLLVATALLWLRPAVSAAPVYHQVTFRRGQVTGARFLAGGKDIVYSAVWEGDPNRTFVTNVFSPEARSLGFAGARVASVSARAEVALLTSPGTAPIGGGVLSRVPMNGSLPAEFARDIVAADFYPGSSELALARAAGGETHIEFPLGKILYRTSGAISSLRVSKSGDIAFFDHPVRHDPGGTLRLVDRWGNMRILTEAWADSGGLAWHPTTGEIWFTAGQAARDKSLWAVRPGSKPRPIAAAPGILNLRDIAPDGRVLISRDTKRLEAASYGADGVWERDLSLLDWSRAQDISGDGNCVLLDEDGVAAAGKPSSYLHDTRIGVTRRLAEGLAMALSPDGKSALLLDENDQRKLSTVTLDSRSGAAIARTNLANTNLEYQWARYFPDGQRLLVLANAPGKPLRLYVKPLESAAEPVGPPLVTRNVAISPDGASVAVLGPDGKLAIYRVGSGALTVVPSNVIPSSESLAPISWSANGRWLFVQHLARWGEVAARISRVDVPSGRIAHWATIKPRDPMGVDAITRVLAARDGKFFVLTLRRSLSELFVAEGLR